MKNKGTMISDGKIMVWNNDNWSYVYPDYDSHIGRVVKLVSKALWSNNIYEMPTEGEIIAKIISRNEEYYIVLPVDKEEHSSNCLIITKEVIGEDATPVEIARYRMRSKL